MAFRSIRSRRSKKRLNKGFELQLTSLIDVLVIILVFLLKSYQTSLNNLTTVQGLQMPLSVSPDEPHDSHQVIITPEGITFENQRIVDFKQDANSTGATEGTYKFSDADLDEKGLRIVALYNALVAAREKMELIVAKAGTDATGKPNRQFDGVLAVTADKRIQYDTLRKIMYTAGAAGYKVFRFIALKKEG